MSIAKTLIINLLNPKTYVWIDVLLIKETQKAILIEFDDKKAWFPKAWILRMMHNKDGDTIKIKISQYHWEKKFY